METYMKLELNCFLNDLKTTILIELTVLYTREFVCFLFMYTRVIPIILAIYNSV